MITFLDDYADVKSDILSYKDDEYQCLTFWYSHGVRRANYSDENIRVLYSSIISNDCLLFQQVKPLHVSVGVQTQMTGKMEFWRLENPKRGDYEDEWLQGRVEIYSEFQQNFQVQRALSHVP